MLRNLIIFLVLIFSLSFVSCQQETVDILDLEKDKYQISELYQNLPEGMKLLYFADKQSSEIFIAYGESANVYRYVKNDNALYEVYAESVQPTQEKAEARAKEKKGIVKKTDVGWSVFIENVY